MNPQLALQRPTPVKQKRVAIFVDAANLFHAAQKLDIYIEYRKLKAFLTADNFLTGAWFYTGVDSSKSEQLSFLSHLRHIGYHVFSKELIKRADGSQKANLDIKIALDMTKFVNSYDTAVLVTGDGDFEYAVEEVQNQGKWVVVIGLRSMTSYQLCDIADRYIDVADIKDKITNVSRQYVA